MQQILHHSICKPEPHKRFKQDAGIIQPIIILTSITPTNPRSNHPQAPTGNQISAESDIHPTQIAATTKYVFRTRPGPTISSESHQTQASKCNTDRTAPEST
ncbi:hypothetical protein Nepgr_020425 [Nepenthes gracilis]|uniref:Uncharacterized protein n=1 Tax=Nepenthes gracilis TaxID=150966 RepID=A0AAD3XW19_NEPGR|nr:hypothetical protein Nepgr_020425 [Nepenthes gracilis]